MTLKQAIMKLPEIDKRWSNSDDLLVFSKTLYLDAHLVGSNSAEWLHAAAKTIGYEIWWEPWSLKGYESFWCDVDGPSSKHLGRFKTPVRAIEAAFCSAVEHAIQNKGD